MSNDDDDGDDDRGQRRRRRRRLVLVRHGRTHMNEYLARPGGGWGSPGFTDVFPEPESVRYYRDSPLAPAGEAQARGLDRRLSDDDHHRALLSEVDLVVVSPLTRALRTAELGLLPSLTRRERGENRPLPPCVALPAAAERCYLVSDLGRDADELRTSFPWVDLETGFEHDDERRRWWYSPSDDDDDDDTAREEWRPSAEGQRYACAGEPEDHFDDRMNRLVDWIDARPERTVVLVCHWGVIDWLVGEDFDNCEMRVFDFETDVLERRQRR